MSYSLYVTGAPLASVVGRTDYVVPFGGLFWKTRPPMYVSDPTV
jgi:hypothetical protein